MIALNKNFPYFVFRGAVIISWLKSGNLKNYCYPISDLSLHFNRVAAMLNEKQISHIKHRLLTEHIKKENGCWEWQGARFSNQYGYISFRFGNKKRRKFSTHRLSAFLFFSFDIDSKLLILHRCDNPPCINPDHLFPGTHKDNRLDCIAKGRNPKTFSDEAKERISVGCKKKLPMSDETKKKISISNIGRKKSIETRAKMSLANKRRWENSEFREKMLQVHLGVKRPKDTGQKISEKAKQRWKTEDYRNKIIATRLGIKASEETKMKMSLAQKKRRIMEKSI